ncbi:MAG: transglutaminase domain-containing protein [Planctomycetota bacterium]
MCPFHKFIAAVSLLVGIALVSRAGADVKNPWVSTDQTVDCSSYDTIIRDLKIKDMKTDEEKALAMFYFFRQHVYHLQNLPESKDPLKNINCLGFTLCGSQATCMKGLLAAIGIKARVVNSDLNGGGDHTYYEAFYDGQWHGFDTMDTFYVYTRGEKKHVASYEELNKDPTLVSDAVKEGRACPSMCFCGDNPNGFTAPVHELDYIPKDFKYFPRDYAIRKGEEMVRSWWPDGNALPGTCPPKIGPGPMHGCGGKDAKAEPFLFKFWEPYAIPKLGQKQRLSYRHYASGQINFSPDLTKDAFKDGDVSAVGVAATPEGLSGKGDLVIPVKSPYYISSGYIVFEATCPGEGDAVTVSVATQKDKWESVLAAKDAGKKEYKAVLDAQIQKKGGVGHHQYWVRISLDGKAVLHHLYLRTAFQYNPMSAPHLMPGKNKVTVEVANADALKDTPFVIAYRYREAPEWKTEKTIEKTVSASPFVFEETLPSTEKLPQMLDLTLRCGALAWTPAGTATPDKVFAESLKSQPAP